MTKILLPVDGSDFGAQAVAKWLPGVQASAPELHLLSVQLPVDGHASSFVNADELNAYHLEEGLATLQPVRQVLDAAGVAYQQHVVVGHPADVICRFATENGIDEIVMGSHGRTGLMKLLMGSVASEVSERAPVKVTLIAA